MRTIHTRYDSQFFCVDNINCSCFWKALLGINCKAKVVWVTNMGCWGGGVRPPPSPPASGSAPEADMFQEDLPWDVCREVHASDSAWAVAVLHGQSRSSCRQPRSSHNYVWHWWKAAVGSADSIRGILMAQPSIPRRGGIASDCTSTPDASMSCHQMAEASEELLLFCRGVEIKSSSHLLVGDD